MGLDDLNSIDIVLNPTPHAKRTLVIVDGEAHGDEEIRFTKLLAKLKCYVAYITSEQFSAAHPGVAPNDVMIGVMCSQPPNEGMKLIDRIRPHALPDVLIRVACVHYKSGGPLP